MSGSGAYRDAGDALSRQAERLADEVRELAERFTPRYFEHLDPELRRWRQVVESRDWDDPQRRLATLTSLRDRLLEALAGAPTIEAALRALPKRVPSGSVGPAPPPKAVELAASEWIDVPYGRVQTLGARLARLVGQHDPSAVVYAWSRRAQAPHFETAGAPMAVDVEEGVTATTITAATPVARGASRLHLRKQLWLHQLTQAVRLHHDTRIGDPRFDDYFLVEAPEEAACLLLAEPVRRELIEMSSWAPPTLLLDAGVAMLQLSYSFSQELVERALAVLIRLRQARLPLALVRT